MTKSTPGVSRTKRVVVFSTLFVLLMYTLLWFNERAIIKQVFAEELNHGYMSKTIFLARVQFTSPSTWFNHDVDDGLIEDLRSLTSGKGWTLRRASDASFVSYIGKPDSVYYTGYYEKSTGQRGSRLVVGPLRWRTPLKVQVDISWYFGFLNSVSTTAVLSFNGRQWVIEQYTNKAVS